MEFFCTGILFGNGTVQIRGPADGKPSQADGGRRQVVIAVATDVDAALRGGGGTEAVGATAGSAATENEAASETGSGLRLWLPLFGNFRKPGNVRNSAKVEQPEVREGQGICVVREI